MLGINCATIAEQANSTIAASDIFRVGQKTAMFTAVFVTHVYDARGPQGENKFLGLNLEG